MESSVEVIRTDGVKPEYIIRDPRTGEYQARGWLTYPASSVLAGQQQEVAVALCDDLEALRAAYPRLEYLPDRGPCRDYPQVSPIAPADFSYYDAGEYWGEDDY